MLSRHLAEIIDVKKVTKGVTTWEKHVVIDEKKIDLFEYKDFEIPVWQPEVELPPYSSLSKLHFDIETTGLDPNVDRIIFSGLMNEKGECLIFDDENEADLILKTFRVLDAKKPHIFDHFNGFDFDLPFVKRRCELLGIKYPFWVSDHETVHSTAQKFGQPQKYFAHWYDGGKTAVIDLYHQVLAWDFVARKLTAHNLKQAPIQMGLRKEARLELSYPEMMKIYANYKLGICDLSKLKEYLVYDLEDTKLLSDFLNPAIYYQKVYLPDWKLQTLSSCGNGSKWNDQLIKHHQSLGLPIPEVSPKLKFKGAYTYALAGFFKFCSKIDVSGMYPSIMMTYGIDSEKDVTHSMLSRLKYGVDFREVLKAKKKNKTIIGEEKNQEGSVKVMNNSAYGMLGVTGKEFNDSISAALVTAYGRAIFSLMRKLAKEFSKDVKEVTLDTDGCCLSHPEGRGKALFEYIQSGLPEGIGITLEWTDKTVFVPMKDDEDLTDEDGQIIGLRKNYLVYNQDGELEFGKGKYVKRDRCKLEKQFQVELIKLYIKEDRAAVERHFQKVLKEIESRTLDLEMIKISRKARKNEKEVFERDLVDNEGKCTYWIANGFEQLKTKIKKVQIKTNSLPYSIEYYTNLIETQYQEFVSFLND